MKVVIIISTICFKGKFDINGYHIEIDDMYNILINNGEEEYFLQGDEADDFIYDMCLEWNNNPNMSRGQLHPPKGGCLP